MTTLPPRRRIAALLVAAAAPLGACAAKKDEAAPPPAEPELANRTSSLERTAGEATSAAPAAIAPAAPPADNEREELAFAGESDSAKNDADEGGNVRRAKRPEGLTRAWFPETFLFQPLVVTDDHGVAEVSARVPDRLTTWRVLALAHSRSGAQAGAVTTFLGTLPTYVEPIVPDTLRVGDQVRVPLQLVNTTAAPLTAPLAVEVQEAALVGEPPRSVTIPAGGSRVEYVRLAVAKRGTASLRVTLGATDAVLRTIQVLPAGRPVSVTRTGTLAAPRTLAVPGLAGAEQDSGTVKVQVYPGALAILRSELGACTARAGLTDDAYALLLAGQAPALLAALGDQADPEAVRELSLLAGQRVLRQARQLSLEAAIALTEAALSHRQNPVLQRLGTRAAEQLARAQLPDGTFAVGEGATLQRVVVTTAEAVRAIAAAAAQPGASDADRRRVAAARVRAAGAFERHLALVDDAYTAAAMLASGALEGKSAEVLRQRVRAAIADKDDGAKVLRVAQGVVRGDGRAPSELEATALAVLALGATDQAAVADLGASLLGGYSLLGGWGDGRTNLVAMRAVLELFKTPVPAGVRVSLLRDGEPVAGGTLTKERLREVLVLEAAAPEVNAAHSWQLVAEPAVPGLGYSLTVSGTAPWERPAPRGLELRAPAAVRGAVGKPLALELTAAAPGGIPLVIRYALPAGVQADREALQALVGAGTISSFTAADDAIELAVPPLPPGQVFAARVRVIPTLAGALRAGASSIQGGDARFDLPPATWTID